MSKALFEEILTCRSLTVIHVIAETIVENGGNTIDVPLANAILQENRLDEIYAICHERIAQLHLNEAKELRAFMERRGVKK